jgi:hypothetical protein
MESPGIPGRFESAGRFQFTDRLVTVAIERLEEAHVSGSPAAIILGLVLRARTRSAGYQQQQDRNLRESSKHLLTFGDFAKTTDLLSITELHDNLQSSVVPAEAGT